MKALHVVYKKLETKSSSNFWEILHESPEVTRVHIVVNQVT